MHSANLQESQNRKNDRDIRDNQAIYYILIRYDVSFKNIENE